MVLYFSVYTFFYSILALFNRSNYFAATQSTTKQKVQLKGYNFERCSNLYKRNSVDLSRKVLCAGGEQGKDSCRGDSGEHKLPIRNI